MRTTILERIRKLSRLAKGSEGNEAEVAARMAGELMAKHAIQLGDLEEAELLEEDPVGAHAFEVGKSTWSISLAWALASHCNVSALRVVRHGTRHLTEKEEDGRPVILGGYKRRTWALGYGHKSDLEIWDYLYSVAKREIQKLAKAYRAEVVEERGYCSRTQVTSFREGAVHGLAQKLRLMRDQQRQQEQERRESGEQGESTPGTAVALQARGKRAHTAMQKAHPRLGSYRGGVGGSGAGRRAGGNINLHAGIGARGGQRRLT
jgi:hypothetical protein